MSGGNKFCLTVSSCALILLSSESIMSDGPHRSLPMGKSWQKVAERADKGAYSPDEIAEALRQALEDDFKQDVPSLLIQALQHALDDRPQLDLFSSQAAVDRVEALRPQAAGRPLADSLVDCAAGSRSATDIL
jgi:hypothetical protein